MADKGAQKEPEQREGKRPPPWKRGRKGGGEGTKVREPRKPKPSSGGDAIELDPESGEPASQSPARPARRVPRREKQRSRSRR